MIYVVFLFSFLLFWRLECLTFCSLGSTLSVYQDDAGLAWDATLVRSGQNKAVEVSRIQLLVHGESQTFHTWDLQYEFGSAEESNSIGKAGTLDSAKRTFRAKFKSHSHLAWKDRHAIPNAKGWIFLGTHHREAPIFTSKTTPLPASVENVLKIIFTSGNLPNYLRLLHTRGRSVLIENKVDKKKLLVGIAVLGKLMDLTNPQLAPVYSSKARKRLCTIYERLILTNLTLSDTKDTVRQEFESLDLLLKLRDASEILEKESQSSSLAMSQISQVLGLAKMTPGTYPSCLSLSPPPFLGFECYAEEKKDQSDLYPLLTVNEKSTEFKMLRDYLEKSSSSKHHYQFKAS